MSTPEDIKAFVAGLKVLELREELKKRGLAAAGAKAVLAQRLQDFLLEQSDTDDQSAPGVPAEPVAQEEEEEEEVENPDLEEDGPEVEAEADAQVAMQVPEGAKKPQEEEEENGDAVETVDVQTGEQPDQPVAATEKVSQEEAEATGATTEEEGVHLLEKSNTWGVQVLC